jgi:hypothetical protein
MGIVFGKKNVLTDQQQPSLKQARKQEKNTTKKINDCVTKKENNFNLDKNSDTYYSEYVKKLDTAREECNNIFRQDGGRNTKRKTKRNTKRKTKRNTKRNTKRKNINKYYMGGIFSSSPKTTEEAHSEWKNCDIEYQKCKKQTHQDTTDAAKKKYNLGGGNKKTKTQRKTKTKNRKSKTHKNKRKSRK